MNKIIFPIGYYPTSVRLGAISGGKLYIGQPDTDPAIPANQKTVSALQENGALVPISQPITLSPGGVPLYNGSSVSLFVDGDYSMRIDDAFDSQIYYIPFASVDDPATGEILFFDTIADAIAADITVGKMYGTKGYNNPDGIGAALYIAQTAAEFDGIPDEIGDFTVNTSDVLALVKSGFVDIRKYGALVDGTTDDLASINAALAANSDVYFPPGVCRCSAMPDFSAGHSLQAAEAEIIIDEGLHSAANTLLKDAGGLKISGETVSSITLNSITSITGGAGAWGVTGVVSDGSKVSIGDIIRVKDVKPGVINPGSIPAERPVRGEMRLGFFQMGELSVTGTAATISGSGVNTYLAVSDLLLIKGQVRKITAIGSDTAFTISAALAADVSGLQYWYYLDNIPAGTASTSGTTVTISGAFFGTFLEEGSLIAIDDAGIRRVVTVLSDTQCTVNIAFPTVASKVWGVVDMGEAHEGAWVVSNVSGNNVTWTNTMKTTNGRPIIKNFVSANIDVYKSQLQYSGDGFTVKDGTLYLDDIALKGGMSGTGLNLEAPDGSGKIICNTNVAVNGFAYGVWANLSSAVYGQELQVCNNASRGVNCTEGGQFWGQKATINGNTGIGCFVGPGSYARLSDARINGNSAQGIRMEVGGSTWFDFGYAEANGSDGILAVGGVNGHFVGGRILKNVGDGIEGQNGLYGRASGIISIGNERAGIRVATGQLEANQSNVHGNDSYGAVVTGGHMKLNEAGFGGNGSAGVLALEAASISINTFNASNESVGINCQDASDIRGDGVGFQGNTNDTTSISGGRINLENATAGFTANVAKNTFTTTFGYIADGTSVPL